MIEITDVLVIAVIVGLVELAKRLEWLKPKYLPLLSLVLGIAAGLIYFEGPIQNKVIFGVILGLSAAGLFDQSKIITKGDDK